MQDRVATVQNDGAPAMARAAGTTMMLSAARQVRAHRVSALTVAIVYAGIEALVLVAVTVAISALYHGLVLQGATSFSTAVDLAAMIAFLVIAARVLQNAYTLDSLMSPTEQPGKLAAAILFALFALGLLLFLTKWGEDFSRIVTFATFGVGFVVLHLVHELALRWLPAVVRRGVIEVHSVMPIGTPDRVAAFIDDDTSQGRTTEIVATARFARGGDGAGFDAELARVIEGARTVSPDVIVLCLAWSDRATIEALLEGLAELPSAIYLDCDRDLLSLAADPGGRFDRRFGLQIMTPPLTRMQQATKRTLDVCGALAGLALLWPLFLVAALLIKLDSPGPVLFRQLRYGYGRRPFEVLKFRTMRHDPQQPFQQATRNDPRVTRIGRLLRRTNLDELPQLFNVLAGTMSLVGPRPHAVEMDDRFSALIAQYTRRHRIKPGMTGLAQVNGCRGEADSTVKMQQRLALDLYYVGHWSLWLDVKILLLTLISIESYRNAV